MSCSALRAWWLELPLPSASVKLPFPWMLDGVVCVNEGPVARAAGPSLIATHFDRHSCRAGEYQNK